MARFLATRSNWRDSAAKVPKLWLDTYKSEVRVITKEALPTLLEPSTVQV